MENRQQCFGWRRNWVTAGASTALLLAGILAMMPVASSQDQSAAPPKDVIFARKILMDTIGNNMDALEGMTSSGKIDLVEGKEHADIVSVMMMAFPHLFPASTNQWKPNVQRDPGTDTFAAPEVWTNFADFYKRATAAAKIAYNASRTEKEEEFKTFIAELRVSCDSCHGTYLKDQ